MAITDPKVVEIRELRFKPANSNDRARAGLEHDFKDVPPCAFGRDDGISPYMGSDSGISGFPDAPGKQAALLDMDIPPVRQEPTEAGHSLVYKLLRDGFGLSVFLHAVAALAVTYLTISLPDESVLNEGETVLAVEIYSETNSEVAAVKQQTEREGEETEEPVVEKAEAKPEPVKQPEKVEKPVVEKPIEQARLPEPVNEPEKVEEPIITTDQPEVLASEEPSTFAVEQAAKQILETSEIKPLQDALPDVLITPVPVEEKRPAPKLAQPLDHPVSKPLVVQKVAEVKPVEKPVEKKPEPKKEELKKPEPKLKKPVVETPEKKPVKNKKIVQRDGNADDNSTKGRDTAKTKDGASQDASQGNSKKKLKGNAALTNYKGLVEDKIDRAKRRVKVGARGQAVVTFTINANGSVSNLRIKKSSGKPAIDKGALEVIRKSAPFPVIPADFGRKSFPAQKTIAFTGK
ncbi:TonB family protein [Rhizobium sp. TH2]|uniref:energy transducer TonB family protein n=1 Tax=Rhizobium sp. TH2 TaxID=2775403 RepID=UPI00215702B6|nr:TonB family protein [Rhizobium sp. TH2]UVC09636.1 TonB family protein [Rhizobium sp. TH2]